MHIFRLILLAGMLVCGPFFSQGAEAPAHPAPAAEATLRAAENSSAPGAEHGAGASEEKHSLPLYATPVFHIGPLPVTNSMIVTWAVALLLIVFAQVATKNIKSVPTGAQNFWEWLVESLYTFLEGIIGHDLARKTFWFFATIFIMILACNWFGLLPGVGSVGYGTPVTPGSWNLSHVSSPILRGANADLNMTLAMSMIFFVCWTFWALQANGPGGFVAHLFGAKGDTTGALKALMVVVFLLVGVLEVVSILFRPVSLSFRLFGNIFAGENMLEAMTTLVPHMGWLIALPFYFMELMVGIVQALVFMLLTAVFTLLICQHDESHAPAGGHGAHGAH